MPTTIKVDLPVQQRKYLNLPTASVYTGISVVSLRRLISAGKLIALRPCRGRIVLERTALESYIASATSQPRTGRGMWRDN